MDTEPLLADAPEGVVHAELRRRPAVRDDGMSGDEYGDLVGGELVSESLDQLQNGYLCSDSSLTSHDVESPHRTGR